MISQNSLQRNIESSLNYDAILDPLKKQINKKVGELFCSYVHNKAMIIEKVCIISEFDELSKLRKEVISELSRCIQSIVYKYSDRLKHQVKYSFGL